MKTLRRGDSGKEVEALTQRLVYVGLLDDTKRTFTRRVEDAVKAWQVHAVDERGKKLDVDGIYGPVTKSSFELNAEVVFDKPVPNEFCKVPDTSRGSVLGREALRIGLAEMKEGAKEVGGNNKGPFVEKYLKRDDNWSWCAGFTSWCFEQASKHVNQEMPFAYTLGAQDIYNQLKDAGLAYDADDDNPPAPGDICVWWRGETRTWQGHVGIVWGYKNGILYVLEGNVGPYPARVRVFDYVLGKMDRLIGFAHVESSNKFSVV